MTKHPRPNEVPPHATPISTRLGWLAITLAPLLWPLPGLAAKTADCRVEAEGRVAFAGKCQFVADTGGSFSLTSLDNQSPLYGSTLSVSVSVVSPGNAEVRGLTKSGINSRWGSAIRSRGEPACWVGEDFRVCAR